MMNFRGYSTSFLSVLLIVLFGFSVLPSATFAADQDYGSWEGVTLKIAIVGGQQPKVYNRVSKEFEEMTGAKVEVVDIPFGNLYDKFMTEAVSHSGAFDIMSPAQAWVGDFVMGGYIEPLDKYREEYPIEDPKDILPAFRNMMKWGGKTYSIITDGDVFSLYYRKSLFNDPEEKKAFKNEYGYELKPPRTWKQFNDIAEFFTRDTDGDGKKDFWGTAMMMNRVFFPFEFAQRFKSYGGQWFDPETMDPGINEEAGVKALKSIRETLKHSPPGVMNYGFSETADAFTSGKIAMLVQWPDIGGHSGDPERSDVVGDVGYELVPGGKLNGEFHRNSLLAWGFTTMISADSDNKLAAYQFLRYMVSKERSLDTVRLSLGLDPFRRSHFKDEEFRNLFGSAGAFLDNLLANIEHGVADLRIPGASRYYDIIGQKVGGALASDDFDAKEVLDEVETEWEALTEKYGVERQRKAYLESKKPFKE